MKVLKILQNTGNNEMLEISEITEKLEMYTKKK